jgi:hypothetical protein
MRCILCTDGRFYAQHKMVFALVALVHFMVTQNRGKLRGKMLVAQQRAQLRYQGNRHAIESRDIKSQMMKRMYTLIPYASVSENLPAQKNLLTHRSETSTHDVRHPDWLKVYMDEH